jgi:hypothetical protein
MLVAKVNEEVSPVVTIVNCNSSGHKLRGLLVVSKELRKLYNVGARALGRAVRLKAAGKIMSIQDRTNNDSVRLQCNEALALIGHYSPPPRRGIRILSIDGGGMRGLIALEILRTLEHFTGRRIHENFDLICGVSTGAIIASFLGFHKKSISEIEETYSTLGFKIFTQNILEGSVIFKHLSFTLSKHC